jgi:hypothetical protein
MRPILEMKLKKWTRRGMVAVVFVGMFLIGAWLSGFNFDKRDGTAVEVYLLSVVCIIFGLTCPVFDPAEGS